MNLEAFKKLSYGLYIVGSKEDDKINAQIANTVFQITSDPPSVAASINRTNLTHEYIEKSRVFSVSILSNKAPLSFIGRFGFKSGREINKFEEVNYMIRKTGAPIVTDFSVAYLECEVVGSFSFETHTVFFGKVVECDVLKDEEPMTYAFYREIKGGRAPKTSPTFLKEERVMGTSKRFVCKVCGYIYDPERGDPENNIPAGTPFESLPPTWICPVCGASKSEFEPE